jgi:hypothetical protein
MTGWQQVEKDYGFVDVVVQVAAARIAGGCAAELAIDGSVQDEVQAIDGRARGLNQPDGHATQQALTTLGRISALRALKIMPLAGEF